MPAIAPYGSWESPITAELIAASAVTLADTAVDGDDVYWLEGRPAEAGRYVIVRRTPDGKTADVTPAGYNVRTTVHEYGGGSFLVHNGVVYFSNFADQRVYRQPIGSGPRPLTPEGPMRYADYSFDPHRNRLLCVREDHTIDTPDRVVNTIVAIDAGTGGSGEVLAQGNDFYSDPTVSPDGSRICWLAWDHSNMPWDGTELHVAKLDADGRPGRHTLVAGGLQESIFQPEWSPHGPLYFVSDRSGWWNIYQWRDGHVERLTEAEAEFGVPQWLFNSRTYCIESDSRLIVTYEQRGRWSLATLDVNTRRLTDIETPYTEIDAPSLADGRLVFIGGSPTELLALVELTLSGGGPRVLKRSADIHLDPGYISAAQPIEFPTTGGRTAYANYYPPKNKDYAAPAGEKPPLLVISHGGPTGESPSTLSLRTQFWTSRGIAVVDVNYGGSTGYGREYRQRLNGTWGIVDVDDCTNAALYLAERGDADRDRLAIRGGSAGGFTTLAALAFRDVFKAGASYYGVGDLEALAIDTHKFEYRYLDSLIGPYPERRDLYLERSPVHHVDRLSAPMIVLQGLEDKVVPPRQAEDIVAALRQKKVPVASIFFAGEQHGFRKAENIITAMNSELYFYSRVFRFGLPGGGSEIPIENL
jgi:dipeptidyl aminopeptidase/acylaminoacyl peptidase